MKPYEAWNNLAQSERTEAEHEAFWSAYFEKETEVYRKLLTANDGHIEGTFASLAEGFGMDEAEFAGFLDGVNTSLESEIALDALEADANIDALVLFDKLYYNMHKAKAPWLYELKEWDGVLSEEKRREIAKQYKQDGIYHNPQKRVGRNDPCPCGSGKKYKNCCGK